MWRGAKTCLVDGLQNAAFLRIPIDHIEGHFEVGEVDEIWITFADPFPRPTKADRRLSSARFLEVYRRLLKPGGLVHVKHDDPDFYRFTLNTIAADPGCVLEYCNDDIYAGPLERPELAIQTTYERMHLAKGKKIKYIRFSLWPCPEVPANAAAGQE
jgi:tRNA (guanine-N7-)-methyltransferase